MTTFNLGKHPYVALCDLLKLEGWCESGGAAKEAIAQGRVTVDGKTEMRKRCKIIAGQVIHFQDRRVTVHP